MRQSCVFDVLALYHSTHELLSRMPTPHRVPFYVPATLSIIPDYQRPITMTILTAAASLLLLLQITGASYQNLSQPFDPDHPLAKRGYSVPPAHPPLNMENERRNGGFGPWPITFQGPGYHNLRYCFKDQRSYEHLGPIVDLARGKWAAALQPHSALGFDFEHHNAHLCSDRGVQADTLIISDETRDGDCKWNDSPQCRTQTKSTGYDYRTDIPGRHTLMFCHLMPDDKGRSKDKAILSMAHELGHALGLHHEHQRPDARTYVEYKCQNLVGYNRAIRAAQRDEYGMWRDHGLDPSDPTFKGGIIKAM